MSGASHVARMLLVGLGATALIAPILLILSLALPVRPWRTGEPPAPPLVLVPGESFANERTPVWIDTDAACGRDERTDPDDCLAILAMAQANGIRIVGVSTVFGNAPLALTDPTTRTLIAELERAGMPSVPVHRGASRPIDESGAHTSSAAPERLRAALQIEPLTILALGPLTNIAAALRDRPDLQGRVTRIVAVMGRRLGHAFHPIEGGTSHMLLGHGPVFRDLNFTSDEQAAMAVVSMRVPLFLVPYEAARDVKIDARQLDVMAARGGAAAWVAQRTRGWLRYWQDEIALPGFYPFDLVAAAYLLEPSLLRCADTAVAVANDAWLFGWIQARGLFAMAPSEHAADAFLTGRAVYCPDVVPHTDAWWSERLAPAPHPRGTRP